MLEIQDYAQSLFDGGLNCAESTILALTKFFGIQSPVIPRIATGFGGGFSRTKNICGALSGGIMALGLIFGRNEAKESKDTCYQKTQELVSAFREAFGSLNCFKLSGVDFNTPEGLNLYREKVHRDCCVHLVPFAVDKVLSMRP